MMMEKVELKKYISVVIPAFNEENYIGGLLEDLTKQHHSKGVHIIVADGGSTDRTVEICNSYQDRLNIEVIEGGSVTRGRNAGLEEVRTDCVLFIDADVRLTSPLQLYSVWYDLGTYRLVRAKLRSDSGLMSSFAYWLFNKVNIIISKRRPFAVGSFFGTRTLAIRKRGGWDESLIHGEDWVLSGKYAPEDCKVSTHFITVDDRRFKKTGYFGMFKLMIMSAWKGEEYMRQDHGYWK
jgi:glycosyltransferase involved in cell wall biosynthesis